MKSPSPRRSFLVLAVLLTLPLVPRFHQQACASLPRLESSWNSVPAARSIESGKDIEPFISDPARVAAILRLIDDIYNGRPLQYPKDGTVFSNKEGLLPVQPNGFYREYTVMPPKGSPADITVGGRVFHIPAANGNRGVERLIIGGGAIPYYTPDHYKTFIQLTILR